MQGQGGHLRGLIIYDKNNMLTQVCVHLVWVSNQSPTPHHPPTLITMEPTLETLLLEALKLGGIDANKPDAYEVWLRHIEDEDGFIHDTGTEQTPDAVLNWAFQTATDVFYDEADGKAMARKFILNLWKKRTADIERAIGMSDSQWIDYPFIEKEHAKTLPDGTTQTSFTMSSVSGRSRSSTRHIKDGKWCRGRAKR